MSPLGGARFLLTEETATPYPISGPRNNFFLGRGDWSSAGKMDSREQVDGLFWISKQSFVVSINDKEQGRLGPLALLLLWHCTVYQCQFPADILRQSPYLTIAGWTINVRQVIGCPSVSTQGHRNWTFSQVQVSRALGTLRTLASDRCRFRNAPSTLHPCHTRPAGSAIPPGGRGKHDGAFPARRTLLREGHSSA